MTRTATTNDLGPGRALLASIAVFIATVVAVVVLWLIVGPWLAVIALAAAFVAMYGLFIYAWKRISDASKNATP